MTMRVSVIGTGAGYGIDLVCSYQGSRRCFGWWYGYVLWLVLFGGESLFFLGVWLCARCEATVFVCGVAVAVVVVGLAVGAFSVVALLLLGVSVFAPDRYGWCCGCMG